MMPSVVEHIYGFGRFNVGRSVYAAPAVAIMVNAMANASTSARTFFT